MSYSIENHDIPDAFKEGAHIDQALYESMYKQSVENPDEFWAEQARKFLTWDKEWDQVSDYDFRAGKASWFSGGTLNVTVNCIDRHLPTRANQTAIIWEGDDPNDSAHITYAELHEQVCRLANVLKDRGVKKGDRVCIYMPMVVEATYAMLACARIGAIHSVVFGGFSPESLKDRILDSDCQTLITADEGVRGGKKIPLKENCDKALQGCPNLSTCIVVKRTGADVEMQDGRDIWYDAAVASVSAVCDPEMVDAETPLFILYTSGSTGKPKGVMHTTGGYLLMAAMTFKYAFDYKDGDIYWCTADVGWVTGHTYI
ncbi:MAG: AMP-binding protein, partial [Porticoccaceae bacterium]|nr:AMP-binding protein [Porticoccaceae bacterium]